MKICKHCGNPLAIDQFNGMYVCSNSDCEKYSVYVSTFDPALHEVTEEEEFFGIWELTDMWYDD